jgi:hypothetical protein
MKTTTIYHFYVVDTDGCVEHEDFVEGLNEVGETSFYKYPRSKHDIWKSLVLGCDMFKTREEAAREAGRLIEESIKEKEEQIESLNKEIKQLRIRKLANYND